MPTKNFYNNNKAAFNLPEPAIHMAQILVPFLDPNVRNLKNSKAQNEKEARQDQRHPRPPQRGDDFGMLAQNSEDPTQPNGATWASCAWLTRSIPDRASDDLAAAHPFRPSSPLEGVRSSRSSPRPAGEAN